jgi:hypothetical protein
MLGVDRAQYAARETKINTKYFYRPPRVGAHETVKPSADAWLFI